MTSRWEKIARVFSSVPKLQGKENWVEWDMRIKVALGIVGLRSLLIGRPAFTTEAARKSWEEQDIQVANSIIDCTDFSILSAYFYLLDDSPSSPSATNKDDEPAPPHLIARTKTLYEELRKAYGSSNAQYTFALGRRFIDSHSGDDVNAWVNEIKAQYRELKSLNFDLDSLCVNVLLNGLPDRFQAFVDTVWTATDSPTIDSVCDSILRINAGQQTRDPEGNALAARVKRVHLGNRPRSSPSAANPCRVCNSSKHWANDCPHREEEDTHDPAPAAATVALATEDDFDSEESAF
ncbi:hypothetical protein EHS25_003483 [Saitozyma podzolica]|jgi:hypothetical protein|uniref:CCHC-type domain-containing protein n=1 Tax=Saitozyma podzolica TaxID=1890683 RepID=A0A427XYC9_9TREE|nr:hypothetical protein EHS25_005503 [Saitozyma podzolica]RSH85518.1 hypothetical protein EHS25_004914 [Saitozyma podzolica]RSH86995.1 hypothetical protein EHS25_003483 [Saitozyma podzolica]